MISFSNLRSLLNEQEEVNTKVGGIAHIEHPSDRTFDGKEAAHHAVDTLRGVISGRTPITKKIDDRMSFQAIRHANGKVGVKYKGTGSHYNYSNDDIDTQHGDKPYLAGPLKALHEHIGKVLPKREGEWQGGFLSTPEQRTITKGRISHTPNTLQYSVPTDTQEGQKLKNSKVSMVVHSELHGPERTASPVLDRSEFNEHPDVHVMNHVVSDEEHANMDPVLKRQSEAHLDQAEHLMKGHEYGHLAGHEKHLRTYINSTVRSGETPSVDGYIEHLKGKHQKEIDKVKTEKSKDAKAAVRDADIAHVNANKKAFDKTLKIHGHVQQATNLLARALSKSAHGGYAHHLADGTETDPEGFVGGGLKVVNRGEGGFSAANLARSAILKNSKTLASKV